MRGMQRREFAALCASGVASLVLANVVPAAAQEEGEEEHPVSAGEDLMREHGVLERFLLIYDEASARIDRGEDVPAEAIHGTAQAIREFIEDYHEKLEEAFVFPRLRDSGMYAETINLLARQHDMGRRVTDRILRVAEGVDTPPERAAVARDMRSYAYMYRPHAAREDTVIFRALRDMMPADEYAELGENFEEREHEILGEGGFDAMVERAAEIERRFGIHDVDHYSPT